jgi:hypothetical protein
MAALATTGCASFQQKRWLDQHRTALKQLADSNMSAEQKMDGLAKNYVLLMEEGLRFANPVKGAKYIQKYHDQNEASIQKILKDTEKWQSGLNALDVVSLAGRTVKKPYVGDMVRLVPKFKKKYNQYAFIVKMTSGITGGLTKFAGRVLGF